jgi:hypothetical protein
MNILIATRTRRLGWTVFAFVLAIRAPRKTVLIMA